MILTHIYFTMEKSDAQKESVRAEVRGLEAMVFLVVMYGCESWTIKKVSAKELMRLNCGVGGDS